MRFLNMRQLREETVRKTNYFSNSSAKYGRGGEIRTHDLLNPIQTRYQATLRPDHIPSVHQGDADTMGLGIEFNNFQEWLALYSRLGGMEHPRCILSEVCSAIEKPGAICCSEWREY